MKYRFFCFGAKKARNLDIAVKNKELGSNSKSFHSTVKPGDKIFLYCSSTVYGIGTVGDQYVSDLKLWKDSLYPYRAKLKNLYYFDGGFDFTGSEFRDQLYEEFGRGWGYKFLYNHRELPEELGKNLENIIKK
jgi:hypothetical protein